MWRIGWATNCSSSNSFGMEVKMKRFLWVITVLSGVGIIAYSAYLMIIGMFFSDFIARNTIFLSIGFLLLTFGIWGNINCSRKKHLLANEKQAEEKHKNKKVIATPLIAMTVVAGCLILSVITTLLSNSRSESSIEDTLRQYVKDEYSQVSVSIPENARYILYNQNTETFETDANSLLKGFTNNPNKVNVVVSYKTGTNEIGTWETETGVRIGTAYAEYMDIAIIRLSDWALIEEQHFDAVRSNNRLGKGDQNDTYEISLYDDEIYRYLNGLFKH